MSHGFSATVSPSLKSRALVLPVLRAAELAQLTTPGMCYVYNDGTDIALRVVDSTGSVTTKTLSELDEYSADVTISVAAPATAGTIFVGQNALGVDSVPGDQLTLSWPTTSTLSLPWAGVVSSSLYNVYVNSSFDGSSASAQNIFGSGASTATLGTGRYRMRMYVRLVRSAGTTSRTLAFGISGTAVGTARLNMTCYQGNNSGVAIILTEIVGSALSTLSGTPKVFNAASILADEDNVLYVDGTFQITTAGTFTPYLKASAAVTAGAATLSSNTYCDIVKIDASTGNEWITSVWA